jgi:hypothetical protein
MCIGRASVRTRWLEWFRSVTCGPAFTRTRGEQDFGIGEGKMVGMVLVGKCRGRPFHGHWMSLSGESKTVKIVLVG